MLKVYNTLKVYLKGETLPFLIGLAAILLVDYLQILIPKLIRSIIDGLYMSSATQHGLLKLAGLIMLISLGIVVMRFLWRYLLIGISRRAELRMRRALFKKLLTLEPEWFAKTKIGELMAISTNDMDAVRMMMGMGVVAAIDTIVLQLMVITSMLILNAKLTLYIFLPLLTLVFIVSYLGRIVHKLFRDVQESFAKLTAHVREIISGIRVVKTYAREKSETKRFKHSSKDYAKKNIKMIIIWGLFEPAIGFVVGAVLVAIMLFGGKSVITGGMSVGELVQFNMYMGLLIWPMIAMGWVINLYSRGRASLDRIMEILNTEPKIRTIHEAYKPKFITGKIEFKGLTFRYGEDLPIVLNDVSFKIDAGTFVAITGRTGCGKTTIVSTINRMIDTGYNTVLIDDIDVKKYDLGTLRGNIGLVPQDGFLFSATIMENIKFGRPDANDWEAIEAAKIAQLDKDIMDFSEGYDSLVGERGVTLSGGQKQRLAIARALLLDSPILIFDDALSAVDTETEELIFNRLLKVRKNKTTIFISHRISTIQNADFIVVLDKGSIEEIGNHQQLLDNKKFYAEIYAMQKFEDKFEDNEL